MNRFLFVTMPILISALIGAQVTLVNAGQTFTNTDLEKYKVEGNEDIIPEKAHQAQKEQNRVCREADKKSKEYWCSKASAMKLKVDKARDKVGDVKQMRADIDDPTLTEEKNVPAQNRRATAERKVRAAKKGALSR